MASLNGTFDATTVEPAQTFDVIPPGDYLVQIIESEMRTTKAGDGQMLALTLEVLEGPSKGRRLWDRLNLVNNNAQAQEIAQRTLSAICHATGKLQVNDSEHLHFIPMIAKVTAKPAGPDKYGIQRDAQNEIKGYKQANGAVVTARMPASQPAAAQGAAALAAQKPVAASPPWRRSA